jgi:hypothetical protein
MVPTIWVVTIPTMLIGGIASANNGKTGSCFALVAVILMIVFCFLIIIAMTMLITPLKIRASITQDFMKSFDFGFIRRFTALLWKEILLTTLFGMIAGTALVMAGMVLFCVGMYAATVLVHFFWMHLDKQLYRLYVSRGGEPVPFSPKLRDTPPPMPA